MPPLWCTRARARRPGSGSEDLGDGGRAHEGVLAEAVVVVFDAHEWVPFDPCTAQEREPITSTGSRVDD